MVSFVGLGWLPPGAVPMLPETREMRNLALPVWGDSIAAALHSKFQKMITNAPWGFRGPLSEARFARLRFYLKAALILTPVCITLNFGSWVMAASPPGDVVGKVTVGYQGWFACTGDGSPINAWWHWTPNSQTPTPSNIGIYCWPDMRQYAS